MKMLTAKEVKDYVVKGLSALYPDFDFKNDIYVVEVPEGERPVCTNVKKAAAVYMFYYPAQECYLRIGKASKGNTGRYGSQNYKKQSSIKTSLPRSILDDTEIQNENNICPEEIEDWIKKNTRRMDIFLRNPANRFELALVESMMHFKCDPKYEKSAKEIDKEGGVSQEI